MQAQPAQVPEAAQEVPEDLAAVQAAEPVSAAVRQDLEAAQEAAQEWAEAPEVLAAALTGTAALDMKAEEVQAAQDGVQDHAHVPTADIIAADGMMTVRTTDTDTTMTTAQVLWQRCCSAVF